MKDTQFSVKAMSCNKVTGLWSGTVVFKRHFDDGRMQSVSIDIVNLSGPKEASEKTMQEALVSKAKLEARRDH